jgi:hypothetical protein
VQRLAFGAQGTFVALGGETMAGASRRSAIGYCARRGEAREGDHRPSPSPRTADGASGDVDGNIALWDPIAG